jgi:Sel1 repeat
LGNMYRVGRGVPRDPAEGLKWLRKAAEQGNIRASLIVGLMYGDGQGVAKNYAESAKWLRVAADQGDAEAQRLLGLMYEFGGGVPTSLAEAAEWYRKAANQGDAEAQRKLAALDADATAGRAAQEAGNAALHKALAEGKPTVQAWEEAAQAAGLAARDAELAAGRAQEVASRAAQQAAEEVRAQASKAREAEPNIDAQRIPGSGSASKPFVVTMDVSVSGGARPIVRGATNLPDGTQLAILLGQPSLPDAEERMAKGLTACGNDNCAPLQTYTKLPDGVGFGVVVKNGQFNDGPFTYEGAALRPGNYVLQVSSFFALTQPENVRAVIGPLGENMTGPLVGGCCFGSHKSQVEIQNELDKMRRDAPILGATVYYARYVVVGPAAQSLAPPVAVAGNDPPPVMKPTESSPKGAKIAATPLSQAELDAMRARLASLWNVQPGAEHPEELFVTVRIHLTPDRRLVAPPLVVSIVNSPQNQAAANAAVRAVVQGQPYTMLRDETYEQWKYMDIEFDPIAMFHRRAAGSAAGEKRTNWQSVPVPPNLDGTSYAYDKNSITDSGEWGAEVMVRVIGGDITIRGKSLLLGFDCGGSGRYRINHSFPLPPPPLSQESYLANITCAAVQCERQRGLCPTTIR